MKVTIDGVEYVPKETNKILTVCDVLEKYNGTREYQGIVRVIQEWFYNGKVPETPWCATCMSWALAQLGLLKKTIDTKQENVYNFWKKLVENNCEKVELENIQRGDLVILNYSKTWNTDSSKHITSYTGKRIENYYVCIGGNQSDQIKETNYAPTYIHSIWRPKYGTGGVDNLQHLPKV